MMRDPQETLQRFQKSLQILQEREAKYAGNAPVELLHQIEDHRRAIGLTEQRIGEGAVGDPVLGDTGGEVLSLVGEADLFC